MEGILHRLYYLHTENTEEAQEGIIKMKQAKLLTLALLITLAAFFLSSCGTNTNLTNNTDPDDSTVDFGSAESFDVVTWNMRTFPALTPQTRDLLAQIIPLMHVDVFACQEINDYAAFMELASLIPHYQAAIYGSTSSYRLAYLYDTRTVQVDQLYTIYDGESNPFPRPPYVFDLTWNGQDIVLINNHLKAMGDNYIDESDSWDEEYRRRTACQMLDQYVRTNFDNRQVIMMGDFNDQIQESEATNVFMSFLSRPEEYRFADTAIAANPTTATVSYPTSFSHIDHILITNELFDAFPDTPETCRVIRVEDWLGSWANYSTQISDHRPLGIKLYFPTPQ